MMMRTVWTVAGVVVVLGLTGCSASSESELRDWMVQQRNQVRPTVQPVEPPVRFEPQAYTSESAVSPFSSDRLASLLRAQFASGANSALLRTEMDRRKEPLEAVPLDTMRMVGLLDRKDQKVALIRADNLLYKVKVGHYLGQNYGRITHITETEISLREIVQDASGEWVERPATLQLVEEASK